MPSTELASPDLVRRRVWERLREVAVPDSRFHLDFSMYIPDYRGSDRIPEALARLGLPDGPGPVFVTPDNNLAGLRESLIREGRPMLMTTYGISRGFLLFEPGVVPEGQEPFAASLDGAEVFGRAVSLAQVEGLGRLSFLVTGASAVNRDGIRFGKGHGYFDLEWAMLREVGCVDESTPVVCCLHDCQYVDEELPAAATDTIVDYVVTPTRTIQVEPRYPKPAGIDRSRLDQALVDSIPPLQELLGRHGFMR